jgi:O-antigen ligase
MGRVFKNGGDERLDLGFGRIGNANDFAAHLLFVLPFVAFLVLQGRSWFTRLISVGCIAYGVYLIAATGSRGALLAFLVGFLFLMLRAPTRFRIVAGFATPLLILLTLLVLPRAVLKIYSTLYSSENTDLNGGEAEASKERRTQLFRTSLRFTVEHPVLGVGMGQFASFEGGSARQISRRGMWQETHNTYTQVSSEDGIPALLFFLAALGSTYLLLSKNYRRAFYDKRLYEFRSMTFCMMLAMVCYASAVIFLSQAYTFYFPLVSGLAIAINSVLLRELANLPPPPHAARS